MSLQGVSQALSFDTKLSSSDLGPSSRVGVWNSAEF